jgi:hypothetical protein
LEFIFVWFMVYAIYQLNIGGAHHLKRHLPVLTILTSIGAIVGVSLCIRSLVRSSRKKRDVHPLLPALFGCIAIGFCAAAIGYAGSRYANLTALHNNAETAYTIAAVSFFLALLVDLLSPFLELVRRLPSRPSNTPTMR